MTTNDPLPPQDIEAEMSLLGSIMLGPEMLPDVLRVMRVGDLYRPDHRAIMQTLIDMADAGPVIDLVTVRNELTRRELLDDVGGVDYIVRLAESVPSHLHAEHYAEIVRDKALLRAIWSAGSRIARLGERDNGTAIGDVIADAERLIGEVADRQVSPAAMSFADQLQAVLSDAEEQHSGVHGGGIPTGFPGLDDMLGGMHKGEMIVVAGRTGMGKSALALNIAAHVAIHEAQPVVFVSLEMSGRNLTERLLCSRAHVDGHRLRRGLLVDSEIAELKRVAKRLEKSPLYICDHNGARLSELRSAIRQAVRKHGAKLAIVDYLQLVRSGERSGNRQEEVARISSSIKAVAMQCDIPIIAVAQLNREPTSRTNNRPRMSDLRESGAIENDADVITLIHREEYYRGDDHDFDPQLRGVAEIIIDKQRNGPTGTVRLTWNGKYTTFGVMSRDEEERAEQALFAYMDRGKKPQEAECGF